MTDKKEKSWIKRHPIWTIVIIIGVLSYLGVFSSDDNKDTPISEKNIDSELSSYNETSTIPPVKEECNPNWSCEEYSECSEGIQKRTCTDLNNCDKLDSKPLEERTCTIKKEYSDKDLYELWFYFSSLESPYTDLQKKENFKEYEGKWLEDSGVVSSVDEGFFGGIVVGLVSPDNPYLKSGKLYFDDELKSELLEYDQYDGINFEGKIDSYSSFSGIVIKEATLN